LWTSLADAPPLVAPVTRIKVFGGIALAIGLELTIAGFIMISRARRRPLPAAIARKA